MATIWFKGYVYIDIFKIMHPGAADLYFLYIAFKGFIFRHKMCIPFSLFCNYFNNLRKELQENRPSHDGTVIQL